MLDTVWIFVMWPGHVDIFVSSMFDVDRAAVAELWLRRWHGPRNSWCAVKSGGHMAHGTWHWESVQDVCPQSSLRVWDRSSRDLVVGS